MAAIVNGKNYKHICNIKRSGHCTIYTIAYGGTSIDLVYDTVGGYYRYEKFNGNRVYIFESFNHAYDSVIDYLMVDAVEDTLR